MEKSLVIIFISRLFVFLFVRIGLSRVFFFSSFFLFFLFSSSFYRGCSAISFNSIFFSGRLASGRGRGAGWGQPRVGMSRRAGEAVAGESEGAGGGALLWRGQEKREKERRRKKREGRDRNGEGVVLERVPAGNNWEERAVARAAEDWSGRGGARAPGVKASSTGNPPSCQDSSSSRKESAILGRTACRLCARLRVFRRAPGPLRPGLPPPGLRARLGAAAQRSALIPP